MCKSWMRRSGVALTVTPDVHSKHPTTTLPRQQEARLVVVVVVVMVMVGVMVTSALFSPSPSLSPSHSPSHSPTAVLNNLTKQPQHHQRDAALTKQTHAPPQPHNLTCVFTPRRCPDTYKLRRIYCITASRENHTLLFFSWQNGK
ncbi:hypothetical protein E2C01_051504 [Portunus trituberculatus]|uniref:Uncharacterized protein n=1 Tax=Portunus trituberculatus TaxID=210409 RepID=A0A5B7GJA9_PORTR|nr:hypothetical protein [Portunus trituberculatus]